jgi:hypothetical protein
MNIALTLQQQQALDTQEEGSPRVMTLVRIPSTSLCRRWTMKPSGNCLKRSAGSRPFI